MDLKIPHEVLCRRISELAVSSSDLRQVAKRLESILPERLREIEQRYRRRFSPGRAQRMALADQAYESHIDQLCNISAAGLKDRILWETHCQLIEARRSRRGLHRARIESSASPRGER